MVGLKGVPFPAGIENFTEQVGWRLAKRGHQVVVYVRPYVKVGESHRGIQTRRLPSINTKHLDALSHTFLATLHAMFSDVDVIHYHALGPSVFSGIPRLRGKRTIAHVHGLDWQRAKWAPFARRCLRGAEYAAAHWPDRTVAISNSLKRYLEAKYQKTVDYVPTGVESSTPRPPREIAQWGLGKENYILFLSRLVPEKGCHTLIEAFEAIETDKKLVIAGPSSHSEGYAESLRKTKHPGIVFLGGVQEELLEELYSNAYLYVLPSELEGLPHSLLQALSFGKCVLASDIDANLEALGGSGMTFRSGDVLDLRRKLEYLLEHPHRVSECARDAEKQVRDRYSWDFVVDRLEEIYQQCLLAPARELSRGALQSQR